MIIARSLGIINSETGVKKTGRSRFLLFSTGEWDQQAPEAEQDIQKQMPVGDTAAVPKSEPAKAYQKQDQAAGECEYAKLAESMHLLWLS